jgi:hypothetical protein
MQILLNKNILTQLIQALRLDAKRSYAKEFTLMSSCVHNHGMTKLRNPPTPSKGKPTPTAWLPRQRKAVSLYFRVLLLGSSCQFSSLDLDSNGSLNFFILMAHYV